MARVTYRFKQLHGDVAVAMRVRQAVADKGGIADLNPALKDWEARFEDVEPNRFDDHQSELLESIAERGGERPVMLKVRIDER
jgi:hypothetical protein